MPRKNPSVRRDSVAVYHPSLARFGIYWALVHKISETPPHAGGPLTYKIVCNGVTPPAKAPAKKATTNSNASPPPTIPLSVNTDRAPRDIRDFVRPPAAKLTK